MSKKNEMQVAENNEWWYCLDGQGSIIIEDKDTYFFQPNGIVPITKGTKFALHNKNQQPLQVVVFN
jgi:mannose-6-phosphate isomerase-like protein (cupin superfamily)